MGDVSVHWGSVLRNIVCGESSIQEETEKSKQQHMFQKVHRVRDNGSTEE